MWFPQALVRYARTPIPSGDEQLTPEETICQFLSRNSLRQNIMVYHQLQTIFKIKIK
jgi:hypothetical protein